MPDLDVIADLITAAPGLVSLAEQGNDDAIAVQLNTPAVEVYRRMPKALCMRWLADTDALKKLSEAVALGGDVARISRAALLLLQSDVSQITLDSEFLRDFDLLVATGVLSASDKSAFLSKARESISLAEHRIGRAVTVSDIGEALSRFRPQGRIAKIPQ